MIKPNIMSFIVLFIIPSALALADATPKADAGSKTDAGPIETAQPPITIEDLYEPADAGPQTPMTMAQTLSSLEDDITIVRDFHSKKSEYNKYYTTNKEILCQPRGTSLPFLYLTLGISNFAEISDRLLTKHLNEAGIVDSEMPDLPDALGPQTGPATTLATDAGTSKPEAKAKTDPEADENAIYYNLPTLRAQTAAVYAEAKKLEDYCAESINPTLKHIPSEADVTAAFKNIDAARGSFTTLAPTVMKALHHLYDGYKEQTEDRDPYVDPDSVQ